MSYYETVIESLDSKGYELLGHGCYAAVFAMKSSNNVIKVGSTVSDPFLLYASCSTLKNNPHFPRIKKLWINEYLDYYVCIMESLTSKECYDFISEFNNKTFTSADSKEIYKTIQKLLNQYTYTRLDMHLGNVLYRNNTPVIVDPLAEEDIDDNFEAWMEEMFFDYFD